MKNSPKNGATKVGKACEALGEKETLCVWLQVKEQSQKPNQRTEHSISEQNRTAQSWAELSWTKLNLELQKKLLSVDSYKVLQTTVVSQTNNIETYPS